MNADLQLLANPQRQAPIAVVFNAVRTVRRIGIAQVGVVVAIAVARIPVEALVIIIPIVGFVWIGVSILAWWRFTFCVVDDELHVTNGVLWRVGLTLPLERVQSASIEQGLVHRVINVVKLSVETAGSSSAEFKIDATKRPVAEALQRIIADRSKAATAAKESRADGDVADELAPGDQLPPPAIPAPPVEARTIIQRDVRRLITAGLCRPAFAGLALLFPLGAVAEQLSDFVNIDLPDLDGPDADGPDPALWMLWLIPPAMAVIALLGFAGNLLVVLLTEWNLRLTLRDRGFVREAGLLSKRSTTTTIDRVQRVEVRRNPLEARFGIQRVALSTVGSGGLSVPGTDDVELAELRALVLHPDTIVHELDRRISPLGVFRDTRNAAIFCALAAGVLVWTPIGLWALLVFAIVPLTWASSRRRHRLHRWGLASYGVAQRHQLVTIWTEEMMLRKVNGVEVKQGMFERKRGLATVELHTAEGAISIGMIPLDEAKAVRDLALMVTETNTKAWM